MAFAEGLVRCEDPQVWDRFVAGASDGTLMQSWSWGELKEPFGWAPRRYLWLRDGQIAGAVSVLRRSLRGGFSLHYAPRGPVLDGRLKEWPAFWQALRGELARAGGTTFKVDPEWTSEAGRTVLRAVGGVAGAVPIQHQATMIVDITGGPAAFARFTSSARRNMRLAERDGVTIDVGSNGQALQVFYDLLRQTGESRHFVVRPSAYYEQLLQLFAARDQGAIYLARYEGHPVAASLMLTYGRRLFYLYSGSSDCGRRLRAPYLIQKRAIEDAQARGCATYDMWGVPLDPAPSHPGYGYYHFKSMFNGRALQYVGLYDLPVRQPMASALRVVERVANRRAVAFV